MFSIDNKKLLEDFAAAIAVPVGLTDSDKWPVRAGTVISPVRNLFVRELYDQIENSNIVGNPQNWKSAFDGVTQLWRLSHHIISGLTDDKVDKTLIASKLILLLEGISALCNDHYFEKIGKHIILNETELKKAISYEPISGIDARKFLMLSGLVWAYSETNYFVAHELTCEYHGPYLLDNNNYVVIRDLKNLKPIELWETRDYRDIPNELQIVTIHDSTLSIGFDVYNNLFDDDGTMATSLIGGFVLSDKKVLSMDDIIKLISVFSEKVTVFSNEVNAMSRMEIANKYMDIFWYRKKSLADYLGLSWKPANNLYNILEERLNKPTPSGGKSPNSAKPSLDDIAKKYDFSNYLNA